ncbi:MAG TPA: amylo-alpha-1,6-glucosidase [Sedimentisphaerales bacterium]|nr:amylo-alpha-1,6-glucosidase [Sedimentisphaerales bacterium]
MPTLEKVFSSDILCVQTGDKAVGELLTKEWLLTNNRGGYASSTIVGCNTRRYHGLLIGSAKPPANRIMGLANCLEMVIFDGKVFNLSTFEFSGKFVPEGFRHIKRFRRDTGVHFDYQLAGPAVAFDDAGKKHKRRLGSLRNQGQDRVSLELTKSVYLLRQTDTVAIVYDFTNLDDFVMQESRGTGTVGAPIEFVLRPFIGLRDFHSLQKSYAPLYATRFGDDLSVRHDALSGCELFLSCPSRDFTEDRQWWFNFLYRIDQERGQDFTEDLWSPGFFKCRLDSAGRIVFRATLRTSAAPGAERTANLDSSEPLAGADIETVLEDLQRCEEELKRKAKSVRQDLQHAARDARYEMLCLAADQFVVNRRINHKSQTTILAGFPWFADWGRDALISLPGLLLATGRSEDAKSVLTTFAHAADEGMIPNRFDDYSGTAHFNSIDASVWFVNAAFQYLFATGDSRTFTQELLPTIRWIIDSYRKGTRFGICADTDGLITGGSEETQLTWMDAKCDGVAFTSRYGKAVEVNALWYNSLCHLAEFYAGRNLELSRQYRFMADKAGESFSGLFWNEEVGYLNDCILPDGSADTSLRPNQIFAVSLPFSALSAQRQKCVVAAVQKHLLTPFGLRTLNAEDSRYKGKYAGPQRERDEAYHQGTVWPYLIGPFVEAYLKVNDFSRKSKRRAAEFVQPLLRHLTEDSCLGQISEIFDADPPHRPRGCIAQAWSVAELIRAYQLING